MASTTNFGWTTPDDTALVKDGAAAIRSLGSSIDSSMADLKGGTSGQVLAKNSNTDMDFIWTTSTPAGANWSLLNTGGTSLTGAQTITISSISGKNSIMVIVDGASSASASSTIGVRVNGLSTSIYNQFGAEIYAGSSYAANNFEEVSSSQTMIQIGRISQTSATGLMSGGVTLNGCNSAGLKQFASVGGGNTGGTHGQKDFFLQGYVNTSDLITSVSVYSDTGNFDAGTVYVYATA